MKLPRIFAAASVIFLLYSISIFIGGFISKIAIYDRKAIN